ncbi:Trp biosynthesis-associated membrane protein [Aeromicrobium sp.]|uniref:Trp biosynthesis-associated membrane protein n=1 Tax=Aeromicrobium sp. TaxID=1871063 RepID=UPI003C6EDCCA
MTSRRLYAPVVLTLLACGGLAFFAASRTWIEATIHAQGLPNDAVAVSGTDAQPLVPALALVVVTGGLAVLAASVRVRRVVGVLLVVVGLGAVVLVATGGSSLDDALTHAVRSSTAFTGSNAPDGHRVVVWPVLAGVSFVVAAMLGTVVIRLAGTWPTMGSRYEAPIGQADDVRTEDDLWAALDEGRDPTE